MSGQLSGDLKRQFLGDATRFVNLGEFNQFVFRLIVELTPFAREIGSLGISLEADGNIFARRHSHSASGKRGETGNKHL